MWASGAPVRTRSNIHRSPSSRKKTCQSRDHTPTTGKPYLTSKRENRTLSLFRYHIEPLCKEKSQPYYNSHICWKAKTTFGRARLSSSPVSASGQNLESARSLLGPSHTF